MFASLVASARDLRNPLIVGYSALLTVWLLAGEDIHDAAARDALGRRLITALNSTGSATDIALVTFAAAVIGSVLWNLGVARLVRTLGRWAKHPDWSQLVEEAREAARSYEEYTVTTYKGSSPGGRPSSFDKTHLVPSPTWASYLHERVDERERKASEMSFRVTLAVALLPISLALGIEGGGFWWWSLAAIPIVWLDVASMKYTTLRTVRRYQTEDLKVQLEQAQRQLAANEQAPGYATPGTDEQRSQQETQRLAWVKDLQAQISSLEAQIASLGDAAYGPLTRVFAFLEGEATE